MSQRPPWEDMLPILADCHRLLSTIETPDEKDTETTENLGMALVKLQMPCGVGKASNLKAAG
jgi:separase